MKSTGTILHSQMKQHRVDAFLVTRMENVRYLSGFTGSTAVLLVTRRGGVVLTDSRYAVQSEKEVDGFSVQILRRGEEMVEGIARLIRTRRYRRVGFESGDLRVDAFHALKKSLRFCSWVPIRPGVEALRMIKTVQELDALQTAVRRAEQAFKRVKKMIRPGSGENEIALALEHAMRKQGAAKVAFDTIVASGVRSAMPHGIASFRKIAAGDLVIVDFGAECNGYFSDMTRTFYVGRRLTGKKREIFDVVRAAQQSAIDIIRPGISFREIDQAARNRIAKAGYGPFFGHGTGHGIGLEVHELPGVTPKNEQIVQEGMVFTIEPGIYLPGLGGVRIEDMVLATGDGCRLLTGLPRGWEI
ncbi:MAG: aminopeptidase P family protein [Deltaproteobacteria bacterium]|nr:aminopeptidase P family protein [Deltaproteobacteria bacterium]